MNVIFSLSERSVDCLFSFLVSVHKLIFDFKSVHVYGLHVGNLSELTNQDSAGGKNFISLMMAST